MAKAGSNLRTVHLNSPVPDDELAKLQLGDVVYLSGRVHTGREGVYKQVVEKGLGLPGPVEEIGNVNFHCSPAATVNPDSSYSMGAVTGTASFRFAQYLKDWFDASGCKVIIGKGGMNPQDYVDLFVPAGAIYLTTVGYGTGALLGRGIKRVVDCYWREELGVAQAMWVIEVEKFGPFMVESDIEGNSLFARENAKMAERIDKLYEGTRPAILGRYGETDSQKDELI